MNSQRLIGYCPTCERRYIFGPEIVGGGLALVGCGTTERCPKGHPMFVENQEFNVNTGIATLFTAAGILELSPIVEGVIREVERGATSAEEGLTQVLSVMPPGLLALVEKLGSHDPLIILLLLWQIISGALGVASDAVTVHGAIAPSNPPAQTIINNYNTTNVYTPAAREGGSKSVLGLTKRACSVRHQKRLAKHQCRTEWNPKSKARKKK